MSRKSSSFCQGTFKKTIPFAKESYTFCQGALLHCAQPVHSIQPFVKACYAAQQRLSLSSLHCSLPRPFFSASWWMVSITLWYWMVLFFGTSTRSLNFSLGADCAVMYALSGFMSPSTYATFGLWLHFCLHPSS